MEINASYIRRLNDATETMYENLLLTETNLFFNKTQPCAMEFGSCHSFGVVVGLCGYGMCQMRGQFGGESF